MKALVLCVASLPGLLTAQSDIPRAVQKGGVIIGGTAGLSRQTNDGESVTTFNFNPQLLRFAADGLAIGGSAGLNYVDAGGFTSFSWSLGPGVRAFFSAADREWLPYVSLALRVGRTESESASATATTTQRVIDGAFGIMRLFGEQIGLDGELFYTDTKLTTRTPFGAGPLESGFSNFGVRFGFSAFLLQR